MISWLRFSREPLDPRYHERAKAALRKLENDCAEYFEPADPADIIKAVEKVAAVFQVSVPDEDGLLIYAAVLSDLPAPVLKRAVVTVCKTHKYKTLPLPAEFLEAAADEMWQWNWLRNLLPTLHKRIENN